MWRLVIERIATLEEIDRRYTLDDIYKANALLDMQGDIRTKQAQEAAKKR